MSTGFTSPFTGDIIQPTDVSYFSITITDQDLTLYWPSYAPSAATPGVLTAPAARIMDIASNSITTPFNLVILPPAAQGTIGSDILINNVGDITLYAVTYQSGFSVVQIDPGQSRYVYLVNNDADPTGFSWNVVAFGATTSTPAVNALAGNGLTALNGKLNASIRALTIAANTTLADTDRASLYTWTGGSGSVILPSSNTLSADWVVYLRNNGTGTFTLIPTDTFATINGQQSLDFNIGDSALVIFSTTSRNFFTVGSVSPTQFNFTSTVIDVDSISGNTLSLVNNAPIIQRYRALSGARTQSLTIILPATTGIYSFINSVPTQLYSLNFQLFGSSQSPVPVNGNTQVIAVADGVSLYILNVTALGSFNLEDGSPSLPSLRFSAENNSGFYRASQFIPAFSVAGNPFMQLEGGNAAAQVLRVYGQGVFTSVDGGEAT